MKYTTEDKKTDSQIGNVLLRLEDFSDERIIPFNAAHKAGLNLLPTSPAKTEMLAQFTLADDAYQAGISLRDIAISGRSEDVVLFNDQDKLLSKRISGIKRKILEISDLEATLVFFDLVSTRSFTQGRQSDIVKNINDLAVKIAGRSEYATVVPFIDSLKDDLGGIFKTKADQKTLVTKDKKDLDPLVENLKAAFFFDRGGLIKMYSTDQTKTFMFFPTEIMLGKIVREESYVKSNQVFIVNPIKEIINLPKPSFTKKSIIEIENLGSEPIKAYKSVNINPVIPQDAINILEFSKFIGVIGDLGSDLAGNLMLAFPGFLEKVKVRITIKRPKRNK